MYYWIDDNMSICECSDALVATWQQWHAKHEILYDSFDDAIEGLVKIYEDRIREIRANPEGQRRIYPKLYYENQEKKNED